MLDRIKARESSDVDRIPVRPSSEPSVASHQQRQLWLLEHAQAKAPFSYNQSASIWLRGPLSTSALETALTELVRRHESLRTKFELEDGEPVPSVEASQSVRLAFIDHSDLAGDEREVVLDRAACDESLERFDLRCGPLFRAKLIQFSEQTHVLLLTWHHIAIDGLSLRIVVDELVALYGAFAEGQSSPLAEPELQYGDFAAYQRQRLTGDRLEPDLVFWKNELSGELLILDLPMDRARPASRGHRGAREALRIPSATTEAVKNFARSRNATTFMVLLAAYNALLYRYSRQTDVLVGVPSAGRMDRGAAKLVGCFINPVVYRTHIEGEMTVARLVDDVRETALRAMAHQELPFELLVSRLGPRRDANQNPIFQTLFGYQEIIPARSASELVFERVEMRNAGTSKFDLEMNVFEDESGLAACFDYDTDVLFPESVQRMLRHYVTILQAACHDPEQTIDHIGLLDEAERQQILVEWNATDASYPHDRCVHELFAEQAARTPERIAVVFDHAQLTYRELNERSNQLAHYLRAHGIKSGAVVGLFVERSLEMVVGLLGVLKAGAAYLPLDPSFPGERLRFMLSDAEVSIVLSQERLEPLLPLSDALSVVNLDAEWNAIARESQGPIAGGAKSDDLIYVMYTSGSTGQPKGVMLTHGGVTNRVVAMQRAYVSADDIVLQKTPYTFDVAVGETFCPLIVGATLVMARPHGHRDPAYLARLIHRQRVTFAEFVPSMLRLFITEPDVADLCRSLRTVVASGEALSPELAQQFGARFDAELFNVYGPTEAGEVAAWKCNRGSLSIMPLGRPMPNFRIHILDQRLAPVPVGVPGEICIGGIGIARGYLRRPDLTAERFVPDGFGPPGERLYRTGDLGRYTADGLIECLGRTDSQVKIRGLRVEVGEIEVVLKQQRSVRDAVVLVRSDRAGDERLVAYLAGDPSLPELRAATEQVLPDYMVPSVFVIMDAFPISANGKVDRKAFPPPPVLIGSDAASEAPLTETEQRLLLIWGDVLGVENMSVADDFFELGANSLLMVQGASRIRQEFSVELAQEELFELPTVKDQAARIDAILKKTRDLLADIPVTEDQVQQAKEILKDPSASSAARMGAERFLEAVGRDQD